MYQEERFIGIMQHLQHKGRISTDEIASCSRYPRGYRQTGYC